MIKTNTFLDIFGGLWAGEVTLFYGPPASGKSLTSLAVCYGIAQQGKTAIYINTETGDPQCRPSRHLVSKFFGETDNIVFIAARKNADLNNLLGGRSREGEVDALTKLVRGEVGIVVVDSVTWHYAGEVKRAPPQYKSQVTQEFQGRVEMWTRYLFQFGCPVIYTAQMKSMVGKAMQAQKNDEEVMETEWIGGNTLGHIAKTIFRFMALRPGVFKIEQIRGEYVGKTAEVNVANMFTNTFTKNGQEKNASAKSISPEKQGFGNT